jgi:ADP-heptose:LPS heptosyltransferase
VALGRPRLVVLRALGLGDLLTAIPALRALARAFPGHERLLAAPAVLAPLVPRELARLVPAGELEPLPRELQRPHYAVNLHGRGPQSHRILLATKPTRMLAFEHRDVPASHGSPQWSAGEHEVERWCRMLAEHGVPADPAELDIEPPPGAPPPWAPGATLIHPGAASGARRWPARRYAAVARAERDAGRDVVVTGGRSEVGLAFEVAATAGLDEGHVLAGRTDLAGLARAVAAAGRVVCGDTGVAHLATALGTPSVVLFGPVSPAEWGPPAERGPHRVIWTGGSGDPHADRPDPRLLGITVADVLASLATLPSSAPRTRREHAHVGAA